MVNIRENQGSLRGLPQLTGDYAPKEIEFYQDLENLQVAHVQIAAKDPEIFEYALDQVRVHTAQVYQDYMEACRRVYVDRCCPLDNLLTDILVKKVVLKPLLQKSTQEKLAIRLRNRIDMLRERFNP